MERSGIAIRWSALLGHSPFHEQGDAISFPAPNLFRESWTFAHFVLSEKAYPPSLSSLNSPDQEYQNSIPAQVKASLEANLSIGCRNEHSASAAARSAIIRMLLLGTSSRRSRDDHTPFTDVRVMPRLP
jgi:hypothetical protein